MISRARGENARMRFPGHLTANGRGFRGTACLLLLMAGASFTRAAGGADSPAVNGDPPPAVKVASVRRVFQDGGHNAFTDLCRFRGQLWLVFRSCPDGHMVHPTASIVVLRSGDGWRGRRRTASASSAGTRATRIFWSSRISSSFIPAPGTAARRHRTPRLRPEPAPRLRRVVRRWRAGGTARSCWRAPSAITSGAPPRSAGKRTCAAGRKTGFEITARGEGEHVESLMLESDDGLVWRKRAVFQETAGDETAFLFEPDGSVLAWGAGAATRNCCARSRPIRIGSAPISTAPSAGRCWPSGGTASSWEDARPRHWPENFALLARGRPVARVRGASQRGATIPIRASLNSPPPGAGFLLFQP